MKKRTVLLALAMLVTLGCGDKPTLATGPNILLLVMDTARYDRCSFAGYDRSTTPYLERLAKESTVYANCWVPAGWTVPSHASLFTGLRPEHHGLMSGSNGHLGSDETLARKLEDAGYATACFSNNAFVSNMTGLTKGFEHVEELFNLPGLPSAQATHEKALAWVRSLRTNGPPFFLFINDMEPHYPYVPDTVEAKKLMRKGAQARNPTSELHDDHVITRHVAGQSAIDEPMMEDLSDAYDGEMRDIDESIGWLLEKLRTKGLLENTVVIVTSDHGENLGEHGLLMHQFSLHSTIRHVPLLIRYPDRFSRGSVERELVRLEDLYPSILEICDVPTPEDLDGRSLLSPLGGRISRAYYRWPRPMVLRWENLYGPSFDADSYRQDLTAVYDGRYHLIRSSGGVELLFDLHRDPGERRPLDAARHPDAERLRGLLPTR